MKTVNANEFSTLAEFKHAFVDLAEQGKEAILIVDGKILMVMDPKHAKEQIAARIAHHFADNPGILSDVESRLKHDASVDW